MPYAIDGQISKRPIDGGVEISDGEYDEARNHAFSGGLIKVHNDNLILTSKPEKKEGHKDPVWDEVNGDWYHEPLPEEEKEEETVTQISPRQARLQLIIEEKFELVEPAIASLPDEQRLMAEVEWEYATHYLIDNPFIVQMGTVLEIDLADFFEKASKL